MANYFHNWTLDGLKNKKYLADLTKNGLIWLQNLLKILLKQNSSKNQGLLAEK